MTQLKISDGLLENVCYNTHKNARNWIAVVEEDRGAQGGLSRDFLKRGAHGWCHVSQDIQGGRFLEFAGDRYTLSKQRKETRRYCKIIEVLPSVIVVEFCTFDQVGKWSLEAPASVVKDNPLMAYSDVELLQQLAALKQELVRRGLNTLQPK
jgi:hypothetical protein